MSTPPRQDDQTFAMFVNNTQVPVRYLGPHHMQHAVHSGTPYVQGRQSSVSPTISTTVPDPSAVVLDVEASEETTNNNSTANQRVLQHLQEVASRLGHEHSQGQYGEHHHHHGHQHTHDANQNIADDGTEDHGHVPVQADWRLLLRLIGTSGIFVLLLLAKLLYDHCLGVLCLCLVVLLFVCSPCTVLLSWTGVFTGFIMGGIFVHFNKKLEEQVHRIAIRDTSTGYSLYSLVWITGFLSFNIFFIYFMFSDQFMWRVLIFQMPNIQVVDIWNLLWLVVITDFVLKFSSIIFKSMIAALPISWLRPRHRGKYFMLVEQLLQVYRCMVPVIPWIHFLSDDQHTKKWFAYSLVAVYSLAKVNLFVRQMFSLKKFVLGCFTQMSYGAKPTADELKSKEGCPICQDEFHDPVMLSCKHIFCEDCVAVWFNKEKTCPMCRAKITENIPWKDGSTSNHLQWY